MQLSLFKAEDKLAVIDLFTQVFSASEGKSEGKLIGELVSNLISTTAPDDLFIFVASADENIIGCIFFSRMFLPNNQRAFILSPVAITTSEQGKGIGQKLISFGIDHLKKQDIELLFTYGDPNFYSKVGFLQISEDVIKAPLKLTYPEGWLAQSLTETDIEKIEGATQCVDALSDQRYW